MTRFNELMEKAEKARRCAERSKSTWARSYWTKVYENLVFMAGDLPLVKAEECR